MIDYRIFLVFLLAVLGSDASANSFTCIDEYGNVTYSNKGCPNFSSPPKAYDKSAYKCTKKNGTTEFTDEPCQGLTSEEVEIIEYNNTQGLSYNEKIRLHNYDVKIQNNREKYRTNNYYSDNESTSTIYDQKCKHHTDAANMIKAQMRKGYKAEQFNYFQDQLRHQKGMINRYCR